MLFNLVGKFFNGISLKDQTGSNRFFVLFIPIDKSVTYCRNTETNQRFACTKFFIKDHPRRSSRIAQRRNIKCHSCFVEEIAAGIIRNLSFSFVTIAIVINYDGVGRTDSRSNGADAHSVVASLGRNDDAGSRLADFLQTGTGSHTHGDTVACVGSRTVESPSVYTRAFQEGLTHRFVVFITARAKYNCFLTAEINRFAVLSSDNADYFALCVLQEAAGRSFIVNLDVVTLFLDTFFKAAPESFT